ncbi:lasso peptide biosynthesis B2 protein [Neobacillus sp. BF23-41]|uniref:lasso peptide biosynthesis B2 protein n=1 Tax=Neobacillus sp. BF23-41 TaxID=3240280 RepID=UPI0034E4DD37
MKIFKRVRYFLFFDTKTKLLLVEAFIFLGWARVLKSMSFSKVASSLGEQMNETSLNIDDLNRKLLKQISQAVNMMSRYTLWESMCLVKAIAAMKMLERRNIESTIYLGTAKDETGKMIAHAWLRSGPLYLTGAEEMERFVVVSKFAKKVIKK